MIIFAFLFGILFGIVLMIIIGKDERTKMGYNPKPPDVEKPILRPNAMGVPKLGYNK